MTLRKASLASEAITPKKSPKNKKLQNANPDQYRSSPVVAIAWSEILLHRLSSFLQRSQSKIER